MDSKHCFKVALIVIITTTICIAIAFKVLYSIRFEIIPRKTTSKPKNNLNLEWGYKTDVFKAKTHCSKVGFQLATPRTLKEENIIIESFKDDYIETRSKANPTDFNKTCDNLFYIGLRRRTYQNWEAASGINKSSFLKNMSTEVLFEFGFNVDVCNRLVLGQDGQDGDNTSRVDAKFYLSNDVNCHMDDQWRCVLCQHECDNEICYTDRKNTKSDSFKSAVDECKKYKEKLAVIPHLIVFDEISAQINETDCTSLGIDNTASQGLESIDGDKMNYGSEQLAHLTPSFNGVKAPEAPIIDNSSRRYFVIEPTLYPECVVINVEKNYLWELEFCEEPHCFYCYEPGES